MPGALRQVVSAFGVIAGVAGIEHGLGEARQGNQAPDGLVIESWPDLEAFRILAGEPALTIVPNLLVTGILAIMASLLFLVWAAMFIERRHGVAVLLLLSVVMLLVGAGFGPPLLGVILCATATRITPPPAPGHRQTSSGGRRFLAKLWPWSLGAGIAAWLMLFPGSVVVAFLFGLTDESLVFSTAIAVVAVLAFSLLVLTIATALASDRERRADDRRPPAVRAQGLALRRQEEHR